ncbi:hypothetical protein G6671_03595 [Polynucleobacter paneuropaeus]|uniref:DUF4239 domain-containing protein n=1 Tax=Polynucleobacter paneuropaeus TaxID=2527775 RepID=A0A9Q2WHH6_9BURK|nr:hypothetical protein [Polynucleobacter paneuropaeus]AWW47772.1 hypothetical protein DPM17_03390 [Polynucleobacter paneuropaeus]MBT8550578.1 hypothetical protein [Polynucleobacter paneuropaeus]QWD37869.1 hypothetical protein G6671_03595 [Polynucleobacter paneuropaeus]RAZ42041.1 hypothetical protein DP176_05575 [Polynucleobacter paneuropaeus]
MSYIYDWPAIIFVCSFILLSLSAWMGSHFFSRYRNADTESEFDLGVIQTATLTLLGLIIGFTFSMAITRYDLRQTLEESEANAISTEYLRADLLPASSAVKTKALLVEYLNQRITFYSLRLDDEKQSLRTQTENTKAALWNSILPYVKSQNGATPALIASGMNDVLNAEGYTQAAWWNRIPIAAWTLMIAIAVFANALVGYGARNYQKNRGLFIIFPLIVSVSFFLIADIDSPTRGIIRIKPRNLLALQASLYPQKASVSPSISH